MAIEQCIEFYFHLWLKYKDIVSVLYTRHGYVISERHLKRISKSRRLFRRKGYTEIEEVINFIHAQLQTSGQLHGYRWMYAKCRENGLHVKKETVRLILIELDPSGVKLKKARRLHRRNYFAKGPNYIWHLDSYDKLKPFGICIDGFSRKIIWLNAYTTSSDPKLVEGYYMKTVESLGGCPRIVRGDPGTENGHVRDFQRFLRRNIHDGMLIESYVEGASMANQWIESWWGFLRKECMEFWISFFGDLKDNRIYDGGFLDKSLLQFCFMGIIQDELDETARVWDSHVIRPSKNDKVPSGRPSVMYLLPELYRTYDYMSPIESVELQVCRSECTFRLPVPCDPDVYDMCNIVMAESHLDLPNEPYQALDLYIRLRNEINASL
ncbi:hypothetical protein AOXY_G4861 [Acipenser oxyrinchus oxyrinchus]|uniref:Integrase core domain-containing protein n=1 Tax=Acipenser oxyrinchus oxyrinchus TaxID=40147 RepID=A0AAD8GDC2_ACIOX|nr:hypothetical protein AOXY_G4861 [Acipenser oxyrinchus oxyrinchus]